MIPASHDPLVAARVAGAAAVGPPPAPALLATSYHESGHAVVARVLGLGVRRACASEDDHGVVTRWRRADRLARDIMRKSCLVALAGPAAEAVAIGHVEDGAARADEANATSYALRLILDEHELHDAELNDGHRAQARWLIAFLRPRAAAFVQKNWPAISRVAERLADGEVLDQVTIDTLMEETP